MENRCASNDTAVGRDGLCSLWDSLGSIDLDFFKLQRELTVRVTAMTGDEISPYKDFLQKQNGRFLAGESLYSKVS